MSPSAHRGEIARSPVPLDRCGLGRHGIVCEIRGNAALIGRLAGMGLAIGARIEVLQNFGRGPLLVRVHETRIALGRGEAEKILVEEATDEQSCAA